MRDHAARTSRAGRAVSDGFSVLRAADEAPHRLALVDADGELTFRELADEVRPLIAPLAALPAGARVSLTPFLVRQDVIRLLAAIEAGRGVVLLHPRWTPLERERALTVARPVLDLNTVTPSPGALPPPPPADGTLALVLTSGTSGTPRAAVLSRRAFLASVEASAAVLGWRDDDRWLLAMPLAHVGGLSILLRCLQARRAVILHDGPIEADVLARSVTRHAPTLISLVPTMLDRLLRADLPLHQPRAVLVGGAACPPALLRRAIDRGLRARTTYGMTETCSQIATMRADAVTGHEGVGPPLPGVTLELRDERIFVKGPSLFDGFSGEGSPLDERGFYDTGDHGRLDGDGHLHLLGRRTDLIVTGGENVYPREVEDVLTAIAGVDQACVVGVPDPEWGHVVVAACTATERPTDAETSAALTAHLARFKHPRRIAWLDAMPLLASGKIDRRAVRARMQLSGSQ